MSKDLPHFSAKFVSKFLRPLRVDENLRIGWLCSSADGVASILGTL